MGGLTKGDNLMYDETIEQEAIRWVVHQHNCTPEVAMQKYGEEVSSRIAFLHRMRDDLPKKERDDER